MTIGHKRDLLHPGLPFRQVHLDFHTSGDIPDVGGSFDPGAFAARLVAARVQSINLFAKCHHGFSYHDTQVGVRHPHLTSDLLLEQVAACQAAGIVTPIYVSAGWDQLMAQAHPDWRKVAPDGTFVCYHGRNLEAAWYELCFNTAYLDYLCRQVTEVLTLVPAADGLWLDILHQDDCCCAACQASMDQAGLDWTRPADRRRQALATRQRYLEATVAAAHAVRPGLPVFHNMGHLPQGDPSLRPFFTHWELESLPTGGWGYDHFPLSAAYARTLGKPYLGMTGKFQTAWGEFGGFKHHNALRFEASQMLAFGARCSVGDQLHPSGELDTSTYAILGEVFAEVEAKEPWCTGSETVADIAVFSHVAHTRPGYSDARARHDLSDEGAVRVLLESHLLFDVIDAGSPFDRYRLVIFPDTIRFDPALAARVRAYLAGGGKVLLSGTSGLDEAGVPTLDTGATWLGPSPFTPDFVLPAAELGLTPITTPMVVYGGSQRLRAGSGRSLGAVHDPYFNRTPRQFCGHQHAPPRPEASGFDAGVLHGGVASLAHPVFSSYREVGAAFLRRYIAGTIALLMGEPPRLQASLPSSARLTLTRQPAERRDVVHLLYGPLSLRGAHNGKPIEVIEDIPAIGPVTVRFRPDMPSVAVRLIPDGQNLPFRRAEDAITFEVPPFVCHQMVAVEW